MPDEPRASGKVQRVYPERGFGFIRCTDGGDVGEDYFFHMNSLEDCRIEELESGSPVTFAMRQAPRGRRAERVQRAW